MFELKELLRADRRGETAAQTLLLLDQLERAHLYLSSSLELTSGDRATDRAVVDLQRELGALIQNVRRIRLL